MKRTILFALGGLLLAGIIHIAIVLMIPLFATRDAWTQMRTFGRDGRFNMLPMPQPGSEPLPGLDPRMIYAACRFTLGDGPVRIRATMPDDFWSIAVFDRRGRNLYSLNDRSVERARLDLVIATPVQIAQLRQDPPESLEQAIVLEEPIDSGFALLRIFVADETLMPDARTALQSADCAAAL